jgi:hypothetical protein
MHYLKGLILGVVCFSVSTPVFGQNNEVSFSIGGIVTSDQRANVTLPFTCSAPLPTNCNIFNQRLQTDPGFALQGLFARRLVAFGPWSLYAEIPVVAIPGRDVQGVFTAGPAIGNSITFSSSALFFTPSARLKLFDSAPVSPFASVGGGLAHTNIGSTFGVLGTSSSTSHTTGALQFGGGVDFRSPIPHLGIRAEARDFYCGSGVQSSSSVTLSSVHLHHIFAGGGVLLRF